MTMRKVRAQALRKAHRKMLESLTRSHRPRVDVAIDSCWSLRAPPNASLICNVSLSACVRKSSPQPFAKRTT